MKHIIILLYLFLLCLKPTAHSGDYKMTIAHEPVNITGNSIEKITINDSIQGPVLCFEEDENVFINVTNNMIEDTAAHWQGLLLPSEIDSVPRLSGFPGIKSRQTLTYSFKLRQNGTY